MLKDTGSGLLGLDIHQATPATWQLRIYQPKSDDGLTLGPHDAPSFMTLGSVAKGIAYHH
jgi:hypothetical protein